MKKQCNKQTKFIKQVEVNKQKLINSKLNDTEKKQIRIYIDNNIKLLKYRFCPHEFFKLVSEYQNKFFSDKLRKKIKRKYKKSKLDIIEDKYPELYEEYFYKSLYFMFYFKSKVGRNYFNNTAETLYEEYKYGYDLNIKNRLDTFKYVFTFVGGIITTLGHEWLREKNRVIGDFIFIIILIVLVVTIFTAAIGFEDNAYDTRLFKKLLQDEFDNN